MATPRPHKPSKAHRYRLPFKEREYFSQNLALLLKSGVPIAQALDAIASSSRNRSMKRRLQDMQNDIDAGLALTAALEKSRIVSDQTLALVRLGENSGRLVANLQIAAQQEEKSHTFRSKVRSALIYPTFVLGLTFIVGLGVAWFLLPRLSATFSAMDAELPLITTLMINFGIFLRDYGVIAVPAFVAFCGIFGYILFGMPGTKWIGQAMLFRTPGISRLLREVEIAQFGYLLGTLLEAGLPITRSINLLEGASTTRPYKRFYKYLGESLSDGYNFKESLSRYRHSNKILDPAIQQMIVSGERSGSLSSVLLTVGNAYEQKADVTTRNLEAILEPILLVIVWICVMLVAVAVIIPIYSLAGGLSG